MATASCEKGKSSLPPCADCGKQVSDRNSKRCRACHTAKVKQGRGCVVSPPKKGVCATCGGSTCRPNIRQCKSCASRENQKGRTAGWNSPESDQRKAVRARYEATRTGDTERTLTNPTAAKQQQEQLKKVAAHARRADRLTLTGLSDWSSMMAAAKQEFAKAGRFDVHSEAEGRGFVAVAFMEKPTAGRRLYARIVNKGGNWTEHRFSGVSGAMGVVGTVTESGAISAINTPGQSGKERTAA